MENEMMTVKRHLTREDFIKWDAGLMTPEEMEAFLSHTAVCDTCAENWMSFMAQLEPELLPEPPAYLTEEIIERSKQPDLLIARKVTRTSRQIRLLTYSLKVGTAVVLSIMMLFSINLAGMKLASVSESMQTVEIPSSRLDNWITFPTAGQSGDNSRNDRDNRKQPDITDHMRRGTQSVLTSLDNFSKSVFNFEFNFNQED